MAAVRYTVILEAEEGGGYHIFCPALPGCQSHGETREDALAAIRDAAAGYLESLAKAGEAIPADVLVSAIEVTR